MMKADQHASHPETATGERSWRVRYHFLIEASPQILLVSRSIYAGADPVYKKACFNNIETTPEPICGMSKVVPVLQNGDVKEVYIDVGNLKDYIKLGDHDLRDLAILGADFDSPYTNLGKMVVVAGVKPNGGGIGMYFHWLCELLSVARIDLKTRSLIGDGVGHLLDVLDVSSKTRFALTNTLMSEFQASVIVVKRMKDPEASLNVHDVHFTWYYFFMNFTTHGRVVCECARSGMFHLWERTASRIKS